MCGGKGGGREGEREGGRRKVRRKVHQWETVSSSVSNLKITPAQTAEMLIVVDGPQRSLSGGVAGGGSGVPNDHGSNRGEARLQWPNYDNSHTHTHPTHTHTHTHTIPIEHKFLYY